MSRLQGASFGFQPIASGFSNSGGVGTNPAQVSMSGLVYIHSEMRCKLCGAHSLLYICYDCRPPQSETRLDWILESVPMELKQAPVEVIADWLEERGRGIEDLKYLRNLAERRNAHNWRQP